MAPLSELSLLPYFAGLSWIPISSLTHSLVAISQILGRDETIRLLPDSPKTLETAAKEMARAGDIDAAALLTARRETAERHQRAIDLRRIEQRAAYRDEEGLERACSAVGLGSSAR